MLRNPFKTTGKVTVLKDTPIVTTPRGLPDMHRDHPASHVVIDATRPGNITVQNAYRPLGM